MVEQRIRFCTSRDGLRLAYATSGAGPPLVFVTHLYTHLERDAHSAVWKPRFDELSRRHTLVRYDCRGSGLSQRHVEDHSQETLVGDLESIVDHLQLERFDIYGQSSGTAIAIAYAVRNPERVRRLVLDGGYARGRFLRGQEAADIGRTFIRMLEIQWDGPDPIARHMLTSSLFIPDAPVALRERFDEDARASMEKDDAVRMFNSNYLVDVREIAPRIACPTLILQSSRSAILPFEESRLLASLVPGARLVPFDSLNHIVLAGEPAWEAWVAEIRAFLDPKAPAVDLRKLSEREREVLLLIGEGFDNAQIAARFGIAEKTVRNHVSRVYEKLGV